MTAQLAARVFGGILVFLGLWTCGVATSEHNRVLLAAGVFVLGLGIVLAAPGVT